MRIKEELKYINQRIEWLKSDILSENNHNDGQIIAQQLKDLKIIKRKAEEIKDSLSFMDKRNRWSIESQIEQITEDLIILEEAINNNSIQKQARNRLQPSNQNLAYDDIDKPVWELGRKIKLFNGTLYKLRKARNLTGEEVAEYIGVTPGSYYNYENMRVIPSENKIKKLEKLFDAPREQMFPIELLKILKTIDKNEISYSKAESRAIDGYIASETLRLEDGLRPEKQLLLNEQSNSLEKLLNGLTDRERNVIALYFGLYGEKPHTLQEVADICDVTRERMRQLFEKAIRKMQNEAKKKGIKRSDIFENINDLPTI